MDKEVIIGQEKIDTIKQIIYWKRNHDMIDNFLYKVGDREPVKLQFKKKISIKFLGFYKDYEIDLDKEMWMHFYEFLANERNHYKKLLDESDKELLAIANAILKGEISKDVLKII